MASSELRKRKLEEYEMQLFSFHSRAVYATLRSIVYERIQTKIQKLCETIEKTYNLNNEKLEVLRANKKQLTKAYCIGARPHLKNIETVVNKCVAIPSNVLLEEDTCQRVQYNDVEFAALKQNLEDLQQRAKRATILNAALKEEQQIAQQFMDHEESAMKMCNIIEQGLACPSLNSKIFDLALDCTKMARDINATSSKPLKKSYNAFDDVKCKETDPTNSECVIREGELFLETCTCKLSDVQS